MDPAIDPRSIKTEGPPIIIGHTPNCQGSYSSYTTPKIIEKEKFIQFKCDLEWYINKKLQGR